MRPLTLFILLLLVALPAQGAGTLLLPAIATADTGENRIAIVLPGETLMELALRAGVGFHNLLAANPAVDPWTPPVGAEILLPTAINLPAGLKPGITINLAEFRLYYLWQENGRRKVLVYPIGIGSEGWGTPEGNFTITGKMERPVWVVPASIREEKPYLPSAIPPGPENPLGEYWLQLSVSGYGIHGTNKPLGVGRRVSHGCIRMYPDDIRDLYPRVQAGTPVSIIYRPIKLAWSDGNLLLEVHDDFLGKIGDPLREVIRQKQAIHWPGPLHLDTVQRILGEAKGIPLPLLLRGREGGENYQWKCSGIVYFRSPGSNSLRVISAACSAQSAAFGALHGIFQIVLGIAIGRLWRLTGGLRGWGGGGLLRLTGAKSSVAACLYRLIQQQAIFGAETCGAAGQGQSCGSEQNRHDSLAHERILLDDRVKVIETGFAFLSIRRLVQDSFFAQRSTQIGDRQAQRLSAMADTVLFFGRHFGQSPAGRGDKEEGIVTEATGAARLRKENPFQSPFVKTAIPLRRAEGDNADESGLPPVVGKITQGCQQLAVIIGIGRISAGVTGGMHPRFAVQRGHHQTGIVGQR